MPPTCAMQQQQKRSQIKAKRANDSSSSPLTPNLHACLLACSCQCMRPAALAPAMWSATQPLQLQLPWGWVAPCRGPTAMAPCR
jgi:hypothetical protein